MNGVNSAKIPDKMTDKEHIKTLLKEGALYRKQSLLKQSKEKYVEALQIIEQNQQLANNAELINVVQEKIRAVEGELVEVDGAPITEELSQSMHNLIRKKFAFSENKETAASPARVPAKPAGPPAVPTSRDCRLPTDCDNTCKLAFRVKSRLAS